MSNFDSILTQVDAVLEARRADKMGVVLPSDAEKMQRYVDAAQEGTYISFTKIAKLGINPRSTYDTPLGIYAYSLSDPWMSGAWSASASYGVEKGASRGGIPFAAESPYIQIFKAKNIKKLVVINKYGDAIHGESLIDSAFDRMLEMFDYEEMIEAADNAKIQTTAGRVWNMTRVAAEKSPVQWAKLMIRLGIEGIEDRGASMIHQNEPHQAVFFSKTFINHLDTILNPLKGAKSEFEIDGMNKKKKKLRNLFNNLLANIPNGVRSKLTQDSIGGPGQTVDDALNKMASYEYKAFEFDDEKSLSRLKSRCDAVLSFFNGFYGYLISRCTNNNSFSLLFNTRNTVSIFIVTINLETSVFADVDFNTSRIGENNVDFVPLMGRMSIAHFKDSIFTLASRLYLHLIVGTIVLENCKIVVVGENAPSGTHGGDGLIDASLAEEMIAGLFAKWLANRYSVEVKGKCTIAFDDMTLEVI